MQIKGSCHCGRVKFEGESPCSVPVQRCYCEQCRKCNGSPVSTYLFCYSKGIKVTGKESLTTYRTGKADRQFCAHCGSTLFFLHTDYPQNLFPSASAIDTPLGKSEKYVHIFAKDKPDWFTIDTPGPHFDGYAENNSLDWHKEFSLPVDESVQPE